jgi:hypothetical protein
MEPETEKPAIAAPAEPERIHRGRIGLNVTVQIALGLALFAMVNVVGHRRFRQWDKTYSRSFSLAETSAKFAAQLKEPVIVTVLVDRAKVQEGAGSAPDSGEHLERDLSPLLAEYQRLMDGRMELEFIDTRRDAGLWENFLLRLDQRKLGFRPGTDGVLVESKLPRKGDAGRDAVYFHQWIPAESFYEREPEKQVAVAFRGESLLNAALAAVTNPDRPRIAVVTNMGNFRNNGEGTLGRVIGDICSAQNIEFEPWPMLESPEDGYLYKSLILSGVTLFGEQQDANLTQFFETPGNSVMVLLDPRSGCEGVDKWLARYGIQPQTDRVMWAKVTGSGVHTELMVNAQFMENSPVTRGLENRETLFLGVSRSLKLLTSAPRVSAENIVLTPLLLAGRDYWGERRPGETLPRFDPKEDNGPPLYLAASAERGASSDARLLAQSSRLVVVGNADLAVPPASAPNYDFLTRAMNWMLHREDAAVNDSSTDKAIHKFRIDISDAQRKRILIITSAVLPLAALMTGLVIWSLRRQ